MKPGYQTTEFWLVLAGQALALLVVLGVITPADRSTLEAAVLTGVAATAALIGSAWTIIIYVQGRVAIKTTEPPPKE